MNQIVKSIKKSPQIIPSFATGFLATIIIGVTGGNMPKAVVGFVTTTTGVFVSTTLVKNNSEVESQIIRQENNKLKELLSPQSELDYLRQQQKLLSAEINNLQQEKVDLQTRITKIKEENSNLEDLESRAIKSKELKTQINEFTSELSTIKTQIQEREKHKENLSFVSNQFVQKQAELEDLKQQLKELNATQEKLAVARVNYQTLQQEYFTLENQQNNIQEEINNLNNRKEVIQEEINQKQQDELKLNNVKEELEHKQNELIKLNEKIENLNQKSAELEIFRVTYDTLQKEYQTVEEQQQNLSLEIPRLQSERDRILTEIQTIESKAQQADLLRRELEELEAQIRIKRNELQSLKRQIDKSEAYKANLENEINFYELKIKTLEHKVKELKGEINQLKDEIKGLKEETEEIKNSVKYAFQALETPITIKAKNIKNFASESEFLTGFKTYLKAKGLTFSERVINAFHTSLKVQDISALVILAGISGTGKSELPQAYAEFIGAPLVMLPVQPRWDSPQDLQGFFNYIEKKYKPTELMRHLYQHQRQEDLKNRMVLVLLDEMNLARVEYYFSDFLSKLETRRNKLTFLEIEAGSLSLPDEEKRVKIPEQFLFVGTMNEDETTQTLSDKVLDRANILTFGKPPKLELRGVKQKVDIPEEYLSWDTFNSWCQQPQQGSSIIEDVTNYVDEVNSIMEALGRPFAHRVYQAIVKYVVNYPNALQNEDIKKQAIADQFGQKILPKLAGLMVEDSKVKPQLEKFKTLIDKLEDESLKQAFELACHGQYGQFQWKGMIYQEIV